MADMPLEHRISRMSLTLLSVELQSFEREKPHSFEHEKPHK
jgi:hypothetical protein